MPKQKTINQSDSIVVKATIIEQLTENIVRATLPNGKVIHAHLPMKIKEKPALSIGKCILVRMNPYNFSAGRIIIDK